MSRLARVLMVVVIAALAGVAGMAVWLMRADSGDGGAEPLPLGDEVRVLAPDPSVELPELVDVPESGTCPAFTFRAPVPPTVEPTEDGYVAFMLPGDDGAAVMVVCSGSVDELGTVEEVVAEIWSGEGLEEEGLHAESWERLSVERVSSPYGEAFALTSRIGGKLLTDHYVERDGWVHIVGYLRPDESGDPERATVEAMLASWEWR